jgi:PST family polysaccharide transporter
VGFYASSEKIARSISGLLLPIRESFYPRISHLVSHSPDESNRLARLGVILMGGGGLALGVVTALAAPRLIHTLMGPGFEPAIPVLQILAALPFIVAITDSVGLQYLLPRGKEKVVNPVMLAGGVLNIVMACILAPVYGAVGMAWSVVLSETFVSLILLFIVIRTSRHHSSPPTVVAGDPLPATVPEAIDA